MQTTLKKKVIAILESQEYPRLFDLWPENRKILRLLISLTYDKKSILAWRAIEGVGILSALIAKDDPNTVRNLVGRLLWMIRDESGGIGWSSPEMLGEIVRNNPVLCSDIAPIIVSFNEEEPLLPGILWAFGRVGEMNKELMLPSVEDILPFLDHPSSLIRGLTVWALGKTVETRSIAKRKAMTSDSGSLIIYDNSRLIETTVGRIASIALNP
ncbi:MAG: HEAT repeat domain-containing protein [Thermodesulfovibrionia bacterium]|nr:HEAT repeat domain-containing protein [Thermodesulfovibrionia bacterium]